MKKHKKIILLSIFLSSLQCNLNASINKSGYWKEWLEEVRIIITKDELSVFKTLETEEDKKRFQKSFWKIRDPRPDTPQNEYMIEFYNRRQYAKSHLGGANSDRGQIYILLGEPIEKKDFSGHGNVVSCELWIYEGEGKPGLPPFMYIIFFKQRNLGDYKLFYPGIHTAMDILSPYYGGSISSKYQAFNLLKMDFPELAIATLSVIPGEVDPNLPSSSSSSNYVFTQIFTLPEKEFEKTYLKNFKSIEGEVDVRYSFKQISGNGNISISKNREFKFLNYSIMPNVIHTIRTSNNLHKAKLSINLKIEDTEGRTIYQKENHMDLELDDREKEDIEEKKVVFEDFAPIIEGEFNVAITFSNKTTEEFFIYKDSINITNSTKPIIIGFKAEEIHSDNFLPFSTENYKLLSDPRLIFNQNASLEGIIITEEIPKIHLENIEEENGSIDIKNIEKQRNLFVFRQLLEDVKTGNYYLVIKEGERDIYRKIISVLPFNVEKPIMFWESEPSSSKFNYIFVIAQEYLNNGDVDKALEYFVKLPESLWNSTTLPVISRAYYIKKDYKKVVELLEKKNVEKNYSTLLLLANSSLELKRLQKAAEYFEMLRKYGDTVEIYRALGAIYYSLGKREKAKVYWDKAEKLEKKSDKNKEQ